MTNCGSFIANQLVSNHPVCPTLDGQALGCPPPLYPRVHLPPVIPARQLSSTTGHCEGLRHVDDLSSSTKPPLLPPRERCHAGHSPTSIPVPPPRLMLISPFISDKSCHDLTSSKIKSEHLCNELFGDTSTTIRSISSRLSSPTSARDPRGGNQFISSNIEFCAEPFVLPTSNRSIKSDKMSNSSDIRMQIGTGSSLAVVNLKTCTDKNVGMVKINGCAISREENTSNSLFSNQIIPLSQWPIPVIVIPSGSSLNQSAEERIPFEWVCPKMGAVANEYVEAPSLHSPSQQPLERPDTTSPLLDVLHVVTAQPTSSSFGKDRRPFHTKNDDRWIAPSSRDLSCTSNGEKDFDFTSSSRGHPCKTGLVCSRCKRCKCDGCARPRGLPRKWVGPPGRQCMCSADEVVRICSCLCCVQTIFYHCFFHPDDDYDPVVDPCACCESERCCLRWSLMAALLPVLPCLCCYCPLQCLVDSVSHCYDSCTNRGCRCRGTSRDWNATRDLASAGCDRPTSSTSSSGATRDLIVESESSSA